MLSLKFRPLSNGNAQLQVNEMNIIEQLIQYRTQSVIIELNGGKLSIKTNHSLLTDELKQSLARDKQAIIEGLQTYGLTSNAALAPAGFSQQRLWFLHELEGGSSHYNVVDYQFMEQGVDIDAMQQAVQRLTERHHSLRSTFFELEGTVYQRVNAVSPLEITTIDLNPSTRERWHRAVNQHITEIDHQVFDLQRGPLLNVTVIRSPDYGHYLVLNVHHIVSDGWSQKILRDELKALYLQCCGVEVPELPPLTVQFADFALWERSYFAGEQGKAHEQYWLSQLTDIPDVHSLPLDYPRPPAQTFEGRSRLTRLPRDVFAGMEQLCQQHNISLFTGMSALFAWFMSRYSGEEDVVFGTPVANREQQEAAGVIGFFVNSLALRFSFDASTDRDELLTTAKSVCTDALKYQSVPFDYLVKALNVKRSASYSPVFQVMFSHVSDETDPGSGTEFVNPEQQDGPDYASHQAKFDLSVTSMIDRGECLIDWNYSTALFNDDSIEIMAECFTWLAQQFVATENQVLSTIPLLPPAQPVWTDYVQSGKRPLLAFEQLEFQASRLPHQTALFADSGNLTFQALNQQANQMAHWLVAKGVGKGSAVTLYLDSQPDLIVAMFAVLKAGGCFITMDKAQPPARVEAAMTKANSRWLFTDGAFLISATPLNTLASSSSMELVQIDHPGFRQELATQSVENLSVSETELDENDLAYIAFTSGTTGEPKGVMISHRNLNTYLRGANQHYLMNEQDRMLQFSSVSFDIFIEEVFCSLCRGAALQLRNTANKTDIAELLDYIATAQTSVLTLPTAFFHLLCEYITEENLPLLASVRLIIVGGEKLGTEPVRRWQQLAPGNIRLLNTYGPTETTVIATVQEVPQLTPKCFDIPIGKPISGLDCYVLDRYGHPCPRGVIGELHLSGDTLAAGYINDEAQTEAAFISNPAVSVDRLYKTGDLARWLPNRQLVCLGRQDHQVKIRGYRIELGEIEYQINQLACVKRSVADVHQLPTGKQLVVWFEPESPLDSLNEAQQQAMRDEVLTELQHVLPDYMIPDHLIAVAGWPLTVNGKLQKSELPAPELAASASDSTLDTSPFEQQLIHAWATVLGCDEQALTVNTNFFSVGGHSLLITHLALVIRQQTGRDIPVKQLLMHQTIRSLSRALDGHESATATRATTTAREQLTDLGELPVDTNNEQPVVLCIPGMAGMPKDYFKLTEALNNQGFAVKAFNHKGLFDGEPWPDVESNAKAFVDVILQALKGKPVILVGHSYGGILALEMMKLLNQQQYPASAWLLDTWIGFVDELVDDFDISVAARNRADVEFTDRVKALYRHQNRLFVDYRNHDTSVQHLNWVFAEDSRSHMELLGHVTALPQTASATVKYIEGDHMGLIHGEEVSAISSLIAEANSVSFR